MRLYSCICVCSHVLVAFIVTVTAFHAFALICGGGAHSSTSIPLAVSRQSTQKAPVRCGS